MSDKFFYNKFNTALIDIIELYQEEQMPDSFLNGKKTSDWISRDWINFYVPLYIRYIDLLKRVEDCYDQISHPQIRKVIKSFVENLITRVCQLKKELIIFSNPVAHVVPGIPYIFLDEYLIEMKLEPDSLNLPLPRYYQEETDQTKIRNITINQRLIEINGNALPEQDISKFFFKIEMNVEDAIKILQNFEIGRQNLKRINKALILSQEKVGNEIGGENKILMEDERKRLIYDHLIAVQKINKTREDEMKFLKMVPQDINVVNIPEIKEALENRKNRKILQSEKQMDYNNYKKELARNIELVEGNNIKQEMVNQRKDWIDKEKFETGLPPLSLDGFYERYELEKNQEPLDDQQQKIKEGLAKDKLKKEQDKKKKDEGNQLVIKRTLFLLFFICN